MKLMTKTQINAIVKKYKKLDKQIAKLQRDQEKLLDSVLNPIEKLEDRWFWLTQGNEWHIKRNKPEAKKIKQCLDRLDSAEYRMIG